MEDEEDIFGDGIVISNTTNDVDPFADAFPPTPDSDTVQPIEKEDNTLTDAEKKAILETWNSGVIDLKELIQKALGAEFDGRSKKGIAAKKYLATRNLKPRAAQVYLKKTDEFQLTEAQRDFITINASAMKPLEITRVLFNDQKLLPVSTECRSVSAFYNTLEPKLRLVKKVEDIEIKEYNPPKTEAQALSRINNYVFEAIEPTKITNKQRESVQKLIRFMHTHRFVFEMSNMTKSQERQLYESSFVRFTYDKPDLTEEEVDLYMNLCSDIINLHRMQIDLLQLIQARDDLIEAKEKVSNSLIEEIGNIRSQMGENLRRQKLTLNDLNGKRSVRLDKRVAENASILNLVDAWRDAEKRRGLNRLAALKKKDITTEIERLSNMDAVMFEIFGLRKEEALNS